MVYEPWEGQLFLAQCSIRLLSNRAPSAKFKNASYFSLDLLCSWFISRDICHSLWFTAGNQTAASLACWRKSYEGQCKLTHAKPRSAVLFLAHKVTMWSCTRVSNLLFSLFLQIEGCARRVKTNIPLKKERVDGLMGWLDFSFFIWCWHDVYLKHTKPVPGCVGWCRRSWSALSTQHD